MPAKQYNDDSSEDEIPVPMKLSALTKALLNDGEPASSASSVERPPSPPHSRRRSGLNAAVSSASTSTAAAERARFSRSGSEHQQQQQQQSRPESSGTAASDERQEALSGDLKTPAPGPRVVRISTSNSGSRERLGSSGPLSNRSYDRSAADRSALEAEYDQSEMPETASRNHMGVGSVSRYATSRHRSDELNLQSSMRLKRIGKTPGSFLSGPARRGRRRQSEEDAEDHEHADYFNNASLEHEHRQLEDAPEPYYNDGIREYSSGSPVSGIAVARTIFRKNAPSGEARSGSGRGSPIGSDTELNHEREFERHDRESEQRQQEQKRFARERAGKAGWRHSKPSAEDPRGKAPSRVPPLASNIVDPARNTTPERRPLASLAHNTPHRAAPPPPPKMSSVLEAAISTTGAAAAAATTAARQRRNVLKVNGKAYQRLECLGRGGSAKVYRVTAENGQMFALKRVALENADEATIRGYRGEIDLLGKLTKVERVINLHAYEMNSEKQVLSLVMEMGERDLNNVLASQQNSETARFNPVFVRFYWKEMLECLQAVHQYDIVHSDLKPANFVLVKGQLKLIDFGIANAIQTDETVNVHRETQIGTPNYMSPESLIDSNNPHGGRLPGRPKLMKLGKPSDIWSLGCILYQMVYGVPPFGHIPNQMARCQAIINWDHAIDFPSRGMGGAPVPPSLVRTLRRCLNRDQHMRPTAEELLHETDPWLYPREVGDRALPIDEELLGRIIQNVVQRCRDRIPSESELVSSWPQAYWAHIKKQAANRL
ncbi:Serine/threonine-protein kinase MPS1 [Escovopsis weberi]|uniref:Serine/threonine-protein kinase MPS1 n=1 Tax=Escovopsis weberi TaxID=150374 RepID=A0A0M9VUZ1_ESCWE|nr:Serine/threonine-protein kinase MPS1 [Escovopsis weberi]